MSTPEAALFTRGEALAGLPARRAQTALYLIESRTARLVARSGRALDPFLGETAAAESELAFVEAFALGKPPPVRPTIQDLEHHAGSWRDLVPENPRGRAALAKLLGQRHSFTAADVPGIRGALGLDQPAVSAAYTRLYGQPLATIYAARAAPSERIRWAWEGVGRWFEALPPFWAVFALTLTETVGVCILALPIALAGVGPIPGVALLVTLGLVNVLTIMGMAEAVARNGSIRYGHGFLSRMVEDYLGRAGAGILWAANIVWDVIGLLVFCLGFSTTLAAATGVPAVALAAGLLLVALHFLRQKSLGGTVTTALVVGGLNALLLLLMSCLAFTRLRPDYLLYASVPLVHGKPFDGAALGLIFGTVLGAYSAHPSVGISGKFVLRRDPSGRSLVLGVMAAQAAAILFYCLWVVATNGVVAPQVLARETGTALIPLGNAVGPSVRVLGSLYVLLAMTLGTVYCSQRLFSLVRERLPRQTDPIIRLPRRRGRLVLQPRLGRNAPVVTLTFMGIASGAGAARPRFGVDPRQGETLRRVEVASAGPWDEGVLRSQWPGLDPRVRLTVTVQSVTSAGVLVQVSTPLAARYEGEWDTSGLHAADLLEMPHEERQLVMWLIRSGEATVEETAAHFHWDSATTHRVLEELVEDGVVVELAAATEAGGPGSGTRYRAQMALRRATRLPGELWRALDDAPAPHPGAGDTATPHAGRQGAVSLLARLGTQARFWIAASPVLAVFGWAEALLWSNAASFCDLLSFVGVIVVSLLAGVYPVLLLLASRRKGEFVPTLLCPALGRSFFAGGIYLLFIGSVFLHGLLIWHDPIQRISAVAVGVLAIIATVVMVRNGALAGRIVVEVRQELSQSQRPGEGPTPAAQFAVSALGRPIAAAVHLTYDGGEHTVTAACGDLPSFGDLRELAVDLPEMTGAALKVWVHRVTPDGMSEGLPARVELLCEGVARSVDLSLDDGQALLAHPGRDCRVTLRFDAAGAA